MKKLDPGVIRSIGAAYVIPEAICLPEIDASGNSFNDFQIMPSACHRASSAGWCPSMSLKTAVLCSPGMGASVSI